MVAQVSIDEDGAVMVLIDSSDSETDTELVGLALDDLLDRAKRAAIETWLKIRTAETEAGE